MNILIILIKIFCILFLLWLAVYGTILLIDIINGIIYDIQKLRAKKKKVKYEWDFDKIMADKERRIREDMETEISGSYLKEILEKAENNYSTKKI